MTATLRRIPGPGAAVLRRLEELHGKQIEVGSQGGERYIDEHGRPGLPVATILMFHEYGLGVPQRSVIRATIRSRRAEIAQRTHVAAARVLQGVSIQRALEQVGRWLAGAMVRRIEEGLRPALAPSTLARTPNRIANVPLLNSGQIREFVRSIRYRVT